jgi:hypothetical protein
MHLRDVNGRDVPISVDVVNTTKELVAGKSLPPGELRLHMLLTPEDERRIQGMMLTGWKGKSDLLKVWASQGTKKNQISREIQSRGAGEQMRVKHLQVKLRDGEPASPSCLTRTCRTQWSDAERR